MKVADAVEHLFQLGNNSLITQFKEIADLALSQSDEVCYCQL